MEFDQGLIKVMISLLSLCPELLEDFVKLFSSLFESKGQKEILIFALKETLEKKDDQEVFFFF